MSELTIRPAGPEDISLIRSLALEIWPSTYLSIIGQAQIDYMLELMYSEASLLEQMQQGKPFILVYEEEEPVGFASYGLLGEGKYKLYKLYVLPGLQGRGTGRFVIQYILNDIKTKGARSLELQVNKANKARIFYEKNGFRVREEMVLDIGKGYVMDDYIMELQLAD